MWEFGDGLRFTWVMGGLARRYGPAYRDEEAGIGARGDPLADLVTDWIELAAETGMPIDPRLWRHNPIVSTYPACQAVEAAAEQGPAAAYSYLRRVREGLLVERKKLDNADTLVAEAAPAGVDPERFGIDLRSNAITEAFARDLDEVRSVPDEARAADAATRTEGHERLAFPSASFLGVDGARAGVWGPRSYDAYQNAALAAGAHPTARGRPEPLEVIERFGRVATREVEEITGRPRPVVEAELWSLAREWRVRAVPVLNGTLWELS